MGKPKTKTPETPAKEQNAPAPQEEARSNKTPETPAQAVPVSARETIQNRR